MEIPSDGYVKVNAHHMYYQSLGKGFPLVLLHGNGQSSRNFMRQMLFFAKHYHVIAIDSPEHGKSRRQRMHSTQETLNLDDMADTINLVLDALQIKEAYFIGFSDGADVAIN